MKSPSLVPWLLLAAGLVPAARAQDPASGADDAPAEAETLETVESRDGTPIAYETAGSGPVLVLVAGALSNRNGLAGLAAVLSERFTIVVYDRRGRGASGDTPPYSVLREVEDLEALIDATGGSAFLFGNSSGAVLALEAANRLEGKVIGAALFEPPFIVDDSRPPLSSDFVDEIEALLAEGRRGDAVARFMATAVGVPEEMLAGMRRSPMWDTLEELAHTLPRDLALLDGLQGGRPLPSDRWRSVEAPVVVLHGERSPAFLRGAAEALPELIPSAEVRRLPDCDHSAPFMTPEAFVPVLVDFAAGSGETQRERERERKD